MRALSEAFSPRLGDRFAGRYSLKALLRGSGAARTFLARDHHSGRDVELTVFDPATCSTDAWTAFTRVVTAAAAAHVSGLELQPVNGSTPPSPLCCAMEVQRARGLDRLREQGGPLPWKQALVLGERFVTVLDDVHAATQVAHRALSAARCVITTDDQVKVLDYGVAELDPEAGSTDDTRYRAPEQLRGGGDHRSDMYSLAAILFELISGERASLKLPSRLRSIVPGIPQGVDDLFARALARDPARRFPDLAAMRATMRELLGLQAIVVRTRPAPTPPAEPASSANASTTVQAPGTDPAITADQPAPAPLLRSSPPPLVEGQSVPRLTVSDPLAPSRSAERGPGPGQARTGRVDPIEPLPVITSPRPQTPPVLADATEVLPSSRPQPTLRAPVDPTEVLPVIASSRPQRTPTAPDDTTEVLPVIASSRPQSTPQKPTLSPANDDPSTEVAPRRTVVLTAPFPKAQTGNFARQAAHMDEFPTMIHMRTRPTSGGAVEAHSEDRVPARGGSLTDETEVLQRIPWSPTDDRTEIATRSEVDADDPTEELPRRLSTNQPGRHPQMLPEQELTARPGRPRPSPRDISAPTKSSPSPVSVAATSPMPWSVRKKLLVVNIVFVLLALLAIIVRFLLL